MSVLFYVNSDKKCILFGIISLKVSVLFDTNSDNKKYVVLFCINSLKVSELFLGFDARPNGLLQTPSLFQRNCLTTFLVFRCIHVFIFLYP